MHETLPIVGKRWLPDNHRKRISGILFEDDSHGLCLDHNGHLIVNGKINEKFNTFLQIKRAINEPPFIFIWFVLDFRYNYVSNVIDIGFQKAVVKEDAIRKQYIINGFGFFRLNFLKYLMSLLLFQSLQDQFHLLIKILLFQWFQVS